MRATGFCVIHAITVMGVSWAARGGDLRAETAGSHARLREAAPCRGRGSRSKEKTLEWEPAKTCLSSAICGTSTGARGSWVRVGAALADEPGGQSRARSGRPHYR